MKKIVGAMACAVFTLPWVAHAQDGSVVQGKLGKDVVRGVVKGNVSKVARCYERGLTRDPSLRGEVVVEFVVGQTGEVESTVIKKSTMGDTRVEGCIADQVKAFVFPRPKGGGVAVVQYPFVFKSADEEDETTNVLGSLKESDVTFGADAFGLAGVGHSGGDGSEAGLGSMGQVGKAEQTVRVIPRIVPGNLVVKGSLDREVIRRVVRQHRNGVRYCYDRQLMKEPNLAGKVTVKFVIAATGKVESAVVSETTLGNEAVESCVAKRVKRWAFPKPKGGGVVVVKYPFLFSSK